jgi:DNA-directed RNA polymerase sigma subunit (sigma70/sigma32)
MPLTEEQNTAITTELVHAYQAKFGDAWRQSLTKNLRTTPIKEIAERHGVSQEQVRKVKQVLWMIGLIHNQLVSQEIQPTN